LECDAVVLTSEPVWVGADLVGLSQVSTLLLMVYGPLYGWWVFTPSSGDAVLRLNPTKLRPEVICSCWTSDEEFMVITIPHL
jgi:hypothetical protein